MTLKRIDTGDLTCATTSGVATVGTVSGTIKKVEVSASASTDFWIYTDASDKSRTLVDENILGATGAKITVNTTLIAYPVVGQVTGVNNTLTDPDQYSPMIVDGRLEVAYASAAADDTYRIVVFYEPMSE